MICRLHILCIVATTNIGVTTVRTLLTEQQNAGKVYEMCIPELIFIIGEVFGSVSWKKFELDERLNEIPLAKFDQNGNTGPIL